MWRYAKATYGNANQPRLFSIHHEGKYFGGHPSCLVRDEHDLGPQLRRLLEAAGQKLPPSRAWLELNPSHPLVRRLDQTPDGEAFDDLALLLEEQAVLAEGGQLPDPAAFVRRVNRLVEGAGPSAPAGEGT